MTEQSSMFDENPLDVMVRATQVLVLTGHHRLADRLFNATGLVTSLVKAAEAGSNEYLSDRAVSPSMLFGPQRATVLRDALRVFASKPSKSHD